MGKVRQGQLLAADAQARLALYDADYAQLMVVEIDEAVFDRAANLIDRYAVAERLLPPDAVILAAAIEEHHRDPIDMFVTTDAVQAKIAAAEGLHVGP